MANKLLQYFSKFKKLTPEESEAIKESMCIRNFTKDSLLRKEGEYAGDTYFILAGLIREYSLIDGEERTVQIYTEGEWVVTIDKIPPAPATSYLICEEDCSLVVGNEEKAQDLFSNFPQLEFVARAVMEKIHHDYHERIIRYLKQNPTERYLHLLNTRPDIINRVPQYQLASYIGVKPESLSRIRRKISTSTGTE